MTKKNNNRARRGRNPRKNPSLSKELTFFRGPERKEVQVYFSQTSISTSAEVLLNGISQGTDYNGRVGNVIRLQELEINLMFASSSSAARPSWVKWAIVVDRQSNGSACTYAQAYDTQGGATDPVLALRNTQDWEDRFMILHEEFVDIPTIAGGVPVLTIHRKLNLAALMGSMAGVKYSSTGSTIASIATNGMYLMYVPSGQAGFAEATNLPIISFNSRIRYTDA